ERDLRADRPGMHQDVVEVQVGMEHAGGVERRDRPPRRHCERAADGRVGAAKRVEERGRRRDLARHERPAIGEPSLDARAQDLGRRDAAPPRLDRNRELAQRPGPDPEVCLAHEVGGEPAATVDAEDDAGAVGEHDPVRRSATARERRRARRQDEFGRDQPRPEERHQVAPDRRAHRAGAEERVARWQHHGYAAPATRRSSQSFAYASSVRYAPKTTSAARVSKPPPPPAATSARAAATSGRTARYHRRGRTPRAAKMAAMLAVSASRSSTAAARVSDAATASGTPSTGAGPPGERSSTPSRKRSTTSEPTRRTRRTGAPGSRKVAPSTVTSCATRYARGPSGRAIAATTAGANDGSTVSCSSRSRSHGAVVAIASSLTR